MDRWLSKTTWWWRWVKLFRSWSNVRSCV